MSVDIKKSHWIGAKDVPRDFLFLLKCEWEAMNTSNSTLEFLSSQMANQMSLDCKCKSKDKIWPSQ